MPSGEAHDVRHFQLRSLTSVLIKIIDIVIETKGDLRMTTLMIAPTQWSRYKDIEDVEPINDGDLDCLAEVSEVLKKYGKRERFGVALLHKHFDLAADEQLVEYTDAEARLLTIKPIKCSEAGQTIETIWELGDGQDGRKVSLGCAQSCWTNVHGNHSRSHQPNNN
jgi:hypothetical protein